MGLGISDIVRFQETGSLKNQQPFNFKREERKKEKKVRDGRKRKRPLSNLVALSPGQRFPQPIHILNLLDSNYFSS